MSRRKVETGARSAVPVEIFQGATLICSGILDAVTPDGSILWVLSAIEGRRLFDKTECQAWAIQPGTGFHYKISLHELAPHAASEGSTWTF